MMRKIPEDIRQLNIHNIVIFEVDGFDEYGTEKMFYVPMAKLSYVEKGQEKSSVIFYSYMSIMGSVPRSHPFMDNLETGIPALRLFIQKWLNKGVKVMLQPDISHYCEGKNHGRIFSAEEMDILYHLAVRGRRRFPEAWAHESMGFSLILQDENGDCRIYDELHQFDDIYKFLTNLEKGITFLDIQNTMDEKEIAPLRPDEDHREFFNSYFIISCQGSAEKRVYLAAYEIWPRGTGVGGYLSPTFLGALKIPTEEKAIEIALKAYSNFPGGMFDIEEIKDPVAIAVKSV